MAKHRVKAVVVEVWRYEHPRSHAYFPYLALPQDIIHHVKTRQLFKKGAWSLEGSFKEPLNFFLTGMAACGIKAYRRLFFMAVHDESKNRERWQKYDKNRGFYPFSGNPQKVAEFQAGQKDYLDPPQPAQWDPRRVEGGLEGTIWHSELSRLAADCRRRGARLVFVFLPHRDNARPSPAYVKYLESMGDVINLPRQIMARKRYWRDSSHLTAEGARLLTEHFIEVERARRGLAANGQ
ncbi:MAG: hypothetical protein JRJ59_01945 [Deltaproteobacteria bacterium]|nr:hypothetical protein [Deltaproteobacteria bacterium]